jgi:hypothetical protein
MLSAYLDADCVEQKDNLEDRKQSISTSELVIPELYTVGEQIGLGT